MMQHRYLPRPRPHQRVIPTPKTMPTLLNLSAWRRHLL